jgi:hypothetical protein
MLQMRIVTHLVHQAECISLFLRSGEDIRSSVKNGTPNFMKIHSALLELQYWRLTDMKVLMDRFLQL